MDPRARAIELAKLLGPERADNYPSWINVGQCLRGIDAGLLPAWIAFSRQSSKYTHHRECQSLWDVMRPDPQSFGITSLHYWAKQDYPLAYAILAEGAC